MSPKYNRYICAPLLAASTCLATNAIADQEDDCIVIRVAVEMEYTMLDNMFTLDLNVAQDYVDLLIKSVDEVYRRELGVGFELVFTYIHDDPGLDYPTHKLTPTVPPAVILLTRSEYLNQFRDWWIANDPAAEVGIERDMTLLVSDLNSGDLKGGKAKTIGGMCNDDKAYAINLSLDGAFPYPLVDQNSANKDIMRVLHEVAHLFGAQHTHLLNPPMDDCNVSISNGGCTPLPGTIMSFCHICAGQEFRTMYFCQQNIDLMNAHLSGATCLQSAPHTVSANTDYASTLENTCVYVDSLQNDYATCSLPQFDWVPPFSTQGGKVEISQGTGEFNRDRLLYYPPPGYTGTDEFAYFIIDAHGNQTGGAVVVTIDSQDNERPDYLVIDASDNSIRRFHAETNEPLGHLVTGNYSILVKPRSIAVLPDGEVLVGETANTQVGEYTLNWVLGFDGEDGTSNGVFFQDERLEEPEAIEVGPQWVWILDGTDGQIFRVHHDGEDGELLVDAPLVNVAFDMTYDEANDKLWVSHYTDHYKVQSYDAETGLRLNSITPGVDIDSPGAVQVTGSTLAVADKLFGNVAQYNTNTGALVGTPITSQNAIDEGIWGAFEFCPGPSDDPNQATHGLVSYGGVFKLNTADGSFKECIELSTDDEVNQPVAIAYRPIGHPDPVGDINGDGRVDGADLAGILSRWGTDDSAGDLDGNGIVDGGDLAFLLMGWTG